MPFDVCMIDACAVLEQQPRQRDVPDNGREVQSGASVFIRALEVYCAFFDAAAARLRFRRGTPQIAWTAICETLGQRASRRGVPGGPRGERRGRQNTL